MKGSGPVLALKTPFLNAGTPYLDGIRKEKLLVRSAQREKWVSPRDFRVAKTPKKEERSPSPLPSYLNAGVMYRDTADTSVFFKDLRGGGSSPTNGNLAARDSAQALTSLSIWALRHCKETIKKNCFFYM